MDNNQWGNQSQNNWGGQPNNQNQWGQPSQNNVNQWGQPSQNNWDGNSQGVQNQWGNQPQQPQNNWGQSVNNNAWGTPVPQKQKKGCLFWGLIIGGICVVALPLIIAIVVGLGFGIYSISESSTPENTPDTTYESVIDEDEEDDEDNLYSLFKGTYDLNLFTGAEGPTDISAMSIRLNKDGTFRMDYAEGDDYVEGTYTVKALNKDTNFDYAAEYFEIEMELEDGSLNGKDVNTGSAEYEVVLLNDRKSTKFKDSSDIEGTFWMNTRSYNMYWSGDYSVEDILDNHSLGNMDLD